MAAGTTAISVLTVPDLKCHPAGTGYRASLISAVFARTGRRAYTCRE